MKPWQKMFMWVGVVATAAVLVFAVQQIIRGQNRKVAIRDFDNVLNQIFPEKTPRPNRITLNAEQRQQLVKAAAKIGPAPILGFSSSKADAVYCGMLANSMWEMTDSDWAWAALNGGADAMIFQWYANDCSQYY